MPRSSHPSLPPASEPNLRRLARSNTAERPLRAQLVVASVLALIVVAVPLYLLRRPGGAKDPVDQAPQSRGFGGIIKPQQDASDHSVNVTLGPVQRTKCSASPAQRGNEGGLCDALPDLENALRAGIRQTHECAPRTGKLGTINYVLEVDFSKNRLNVFPGRSGKWKGPQARRAAKCVLGSFPPVPWERLAHQYRYYNIAIQASYPAPDPLEVLPEFD
jgi:hypothetical protein